MSGASQRPASPSRFADPPRTADAFRVADAFAGAIMRLDPGAPAELADWARRVWLAAGDGHACVPVPEQAVRDSLARSAALVPAGPETPPAAVTGAPLVLDGDALYLQRLWQAEALLAERIVALDSPAPLADEAALVAALDAVAPPGEVDPLQRDAVRTGLTRRLAIVTGGPGTGKTTTMARLVAAVRQLVPDARLAIAAPTGKAAARLAQALAGTAPGASIGGMTVHRLLGLRGDDSPAAPGPRGADLIIVDEASMLDLQLARALLEAVPAGGRLVLAGDRDQLVSVEAGAVFAELCASGLTSVVRLQRNFRQSAAPGLAALAAWLRDCWQTPQPLPAPEGFVLRGPGPAALIADEAVDAWAPALASFEGAGPAARLAAFDSHRVLCALRDGPLGTRAVNAAIAIRMRRLAGVPPGALWYAGRTVMVTRNSPERRLFNGDVGVCLPQPEADGRLAVAFAGGAEAGRGGSRESDQEGGGLRWHPLRQLPAHEDAFAMTVHKSQGSEFDSVALVPAPPGHPLNTRELLYTGVTRARRRLTIWADGATLEDGALRRTARHGRLADRIVRLQAAGRQGPSR